CAPEDPGTAVCLLPGTELSFAGEVMCLATGLFPWRERALNYNTAIFRQINKDKVAAHHDALEFPDGRSILLTAIGGRPAGHGAAAAGAAEDKRRSGGSETSRLRRLIATTRERKAGPSQFAGRPSLRIWGV